MDRWIDGTFGDWGGLIDSLDVDGCVCKVVVYANYVDIALTESRVLMLSM